MGTVQVYTIDVVCTCVLYRCTVDIVCTCVLYMCTVQVYKECSDKELIQEVTEEGFLFLVGR